MIERNGRKEYLLKTRIKGEIERACYLNTWGLRTLIREINNNSVAIVDTIAVITMRDNGEVMRVYPEELREITPLQNDN